MIIAMILFIAILYFGLYFIYLEYNKDRDEVEQRILKLEERHNRNAEKFEKDIMIIKQLLNLTEKKGSKKK